MKCVIILLLLSIFIPDHVCSGESNNQPKPLPNLFASWLGKSEEQVDAKLQAAWKLYFEGDPQSQRLYYETGADMAYIWDVANNDVRTEGISYGMMIAVQMDQQDVFDRLWKWAVTHMLHESGPLKDYFAWHCDREGNRLSEGPASDGEEWFAMTLLLAGERWGNGEGIFDYHAEAKRILHAMPVREEHGHYIPMFDQHAAMVRFVPNRDWKRVSDPSYHLPAFYEIWAGWDDKYRELWQRAAKTSREYFRLVAHPKTGLMPDYATFEGKPYVWQGHEDFRFDAFRVLSNVAMDWAMWGKDPWAVEQSNRILKFFSTFGENLPNQMTLDGKPLSNQSSTGLYAMAATAGLAADREVAQPFVENLWQMQPPSGHYRYYDGLLYFLSLLQVSGRFHLHFPN